MKTKTLSILIVYVCILFGCKKSSDSDIAPIDIGPIINHNISAEQAIKIAVLNSIFPEQIKIPGRGKVSSLDGSIGNKRQPAKKVKSNFSFKYDQSVPSFYIINYEGGGFAIVAGDDRLNPILAYSDESSFPIDEKGSYPSGLVNWLEDTNALVKHVRKQGDEQDIDVDMAWKDLELKSQLTMGSLEDVNFPPCTITVEGQQFTHTTTVGPFLQTTWGQGVGYNDNMINLGCTSYSNGRAPVGCVPVATAQIMKFYQYPTSIAWSAMPTTYGSSTTAMLMANLASEMGTSPGCDGSGTSTANAATVLKNKYRYISATYNATYNYNTVLAELKGNRPVILSGGKNGTKFWFFNVYQDGHAWVADGYRELDYYTCRIPEWPPAPEEVPWWEQTYGTLYFHMNWGWNGQFNGWFGYNNWNPSTYTFNYKPGMITNIRPGN